MEGIRRVVDTGVLVDIQRAVSNSYHMPVRTVPEISLQVFLITYLLHSPTFRPTPIQTVLNHLSRRLGQCVFNPVLLMSIRCGSIQCTNAYTLYIHRF